MYGDFVTEWLQRSSGAITDATGFNLPGMPNSTSIPVGQNNSSTGVSGIFKSIPTWVWLAVGGYILVKKIL